MTVRYVKFEVELHGLDLTGDGAAEKLLEELDAAVREYVHPGGLSNILKSDVEVTLIEVAGIS